MTRLTLSGCIADEDGLVRQGDGTAMRWPAGAYRDEQGERVPVRVRHSGPAVGEVIHFEQSGRWLMAVAVVDEATIHTLAAGMTYFSPSVHRNADESITVTEVSLVAEPASVGLGPVKALVGDVTSYVDVRRWPMNVASRPLLRNAAVDYAQRRRNGWQLEVHGRGERIYVSGQFVGRSR